ncbi:MAG TPA: 50S ribosomal protein L2 [Candidatus Saccharimonadales bacterium]|jgi:large subunit ribosomal protein L2
MAIKPYKPTTPARRGMTTSDFSKITTKKPLKSLTIPKKQRAGRNQAGRITVRHRGGGAKKMYRLVNFNLPVGLEAVVEGIEYDPNRSAHIARIKDSEGKYHYVLAGSGLKVGHKLTVGDESTIEPGNRLMLSVIPLGSVVYNIELQPGRGGQLVRSAGTGAQLISREGKMAQLKLPSGEVRSVNVECQATIGSVGNAQHQNIKLGSAGRRRRQGWRPSVRGVAMNAADHPMGGGEGKGKGNDPQSPWGQPTLGFKTRRRKSTDKFIVRSRHQSKRR